MTNSTNKGSMCSFQACKLFEFRRQYEIDYQIMIKDSRDFPPLTKGRYTLGNKLQQHVAATDHSM